MSKRKSRKRAAVGYDEYVEPATSLIDLPATIEERHTHYEVTGPPTNYLINVPNPSLDSIAQSAPIDNRQPAPSSSSLIEHNEDDAESNEDANRVLEILGHQQTRAEEPSTAGTGSNKRRRTDSDLPLLAWVPYIDCFVDELLRLEGPGDSFGQLECAHLGCVVPVNFRSSEPNHPGFRCRDCFDVRFFCSGCILTSHCTSPFHRIEKWSGHNFERISLKSMGLRIQLGHLTGLCPLPSPSFDDQFTIIDSGGIHEVALDYCGCEHALPKHIQLLRARLFPSTVVDPRTAATFTVLNQFQMTSFTSKITGFEFYRSLARQTDNLGVSPPPDRYHAFMRMVREWRHVRLLKRMGRGHSESGVKGTQEGECAVLCPACPLPGINLPDDWKERPNPWLYALFIGMDANFRLKRLNVSSDERDPGLNHGYAYVVENKAYQEYLSIYNTKIEEGEKSTCHNHDAIKSANMRGKKGTASTGMGTAECSRHDMKRPTAVAELQKGERYVNMDYLLLCSLRRYIPLHMVLSYDIICQWLRNFLKRCAIYSQSLNTASIFSLIITYLIPKFHLPAHVGGCQINYSFNLTPHVGRTDGEAPERGWSLTNAIASSTKQMGPGSFRDTVDDFMGDYNWRKVAQISETFLRKAEEAISGRQEHVEAFVEFDAALPSDTTSVWTKMCQEWELDPSGTVKKTANNPFFNPVTFVTDHEVRARLALADQAELQAGRATTVHKEVTPSMLIYQGLELEEHQQRHAGEVGELGTHSTSLQRAKVLERANNLTRKLDAWIELQHLYAPALAALRSQLDKDGVGKDPIPVQNVALFLPSELQAIRKTPKRRFVIIEFHFRIARAQSALSDLRSLLIMRDMMYKSKERLSRGQGAQTRSITLIRNVEQRVQGAANRYRRHHSALKSLSEILLESNWEKELRVLNDRDMDGLTSLDNTEAEGRKKLTWIWNVQGFDPDNAASTQSALRIEWCKARARAHRWQEECLLLREEMRRVIAFFSWEVNKWTGLANEYELMPSTSEHGVPMLAAADINAKDIIRYGKIGYAYRQVASRRSMIMHCTKVWCGLEDKLGNLEGYDAFSMVECH